MKKTNIVKGQCRGWTMKSQLTEKCTFLKVSMCVLVRQGKDKKCAKFQAQKRFSSSQSTAQHYKKHFWTSTNNFWSLAASTRPLPCINKKLSLKMAKLKNGMKNKNSLFRQNKCMLVLSKYRQNHACVYF